MTYPTPEEVKRVAIECGFDFRRCEAGELATSHSHELQAFATRMIEIGRKMQREGDANLFEADPSMESFNFVASAIRNNTGE